MTTFLDRSSTGAVGAFCPPSHWKAKGDVPSNFQSIEIPAHRYAVFPHFGPVLAGGRLIVVSGDGYMREVDPASGKLLRATPIGGVAAANPIVAGRTLYVLTDDGRLHAFR